MTAEVMQLREAEIHPMQEIREIPLAENLAEYNDLETNDKYFNLYQNMRLRQLMRLKEKKVFPMVRFAKDNEFEDFNNQAQNVFALLLPDKILGFNISNMQVEDENEIKKEK
jgi:archaeosine-15-forming tRNA-guanine transglycosylase